MSGLFGELDIASAQDNPFFKPDGTYTCEIADAQIKTSKKGNKGFAIDYSIVQGFKKGKKIQEWKSIPMPWELKGYATEAMTGAVDEKIKERAERDLAFLKARFKDFGIPVEEMNSVDREYLLNKVGKLDITIKNSDGNERITGVKKHDSDSDSSRDPFA